MKLVNFLCSFLIFVISCAPENPTNPPKIPKSTNIEFVTQENIIFHNDITFANDERNMFDDVAGYVYLQSSGILKVSYVYDLDVSKSDVTKMSNVIIKISSNSDFIKNLDAKDKLIGGYTFQGSKKIYIVYDRLNSSIVFKHVVFHEILHTFQLMHVNDEEAVMYLRANQSLCINKTDAQELCRIYNCNYDKMNYCE